MLLAGRAERARQSRDFNLRSSPEIAAAAVAIEWHTVFPSEDEPVKPGQDDGSSNGKQDRVKHATMTMKSKYSH